MDLSKKMWFRLIIMLRSWFILGVLFRQVILINLHTVSLSPIKWANAGTNGLEQKKRWFRLTTMLMSWFDWSFTHKQIHFMKKTCTFFKFFFYDYQNDFNHRAMPSASSRQVPVSLQSWELELPTRKNVCTPLGTRICSCSRYIHWRWMAYNPLSCCHSTSFLFLICMFFQLIL